MSIISRESRRRAPPRADDPRVVRTRAAVVEAGRTLFLRQGYVGTTMEEIAALAGVTKRTVYNNYADKQTLFLQIVGEATAFAEGFARGLEAEFTVGMTAVGVRSLLHDLARRMTLAILRPEVIALRRLLVCEAQTFPALAADYFDRAPGQVMKALAAGFTHLDRAGLLRVTDARHAAGQFAYLVVGEPLDRAMLTGIAPLAEEVANSAREGVETFLARYGAP